MPPIHLKYLDICIKIITFVLDKALPWVQCKRKIRGMVKKLMLHEVKPSAVFISSPCPSAIFFILHEHKNFIFMTASRIKQLLVDKRSLLLLILLLSYNIPASPFSPGRPIAPWRPTTPGRPCGPGGPCRPGGPGSHEQPFPDCLFTSWWVLMVLS